MPRSARAKQRGRVVDSDDDDGESSRASDISSLDDEPLLDIEATEARFDENFAESESPLEKFYPFLRLPPELRQRVWEMFCPDLTAKGRVLGFRTSRSFTCPITDGLLLPSQTESLRRMLAVHQESRTLARRAFPDVAIMFGYCEFHFNKQKDIFHFEDLDNFAFYSPNDWNCVKDFTKVALPLDALELMRDTDAEIVEELLMPFTSMQYCFLAEATSRRKRSIKWVVSEKTLKYAMQAEETEPGIGEKMDVVWCWPDVDNDFEFGLDAADSVRDRVDDDFFNQLFGSRDIGPYPMACVGYNEPWSIIDGLAQLDENDPEAPFSPESDTFSILAPYDPLLDEYESEGIDDSEIVSLASDDFLIPEEISAFYGDLEGGEVNGRFSSLDPDDDDSSSDSDEVEIVGGDGPERNRLQNRPIVLDSEDMPGSEVLQQPSRSRRRRAVMEDSDEDDDEDGDEDRPRKRQRRTGQSHAIVVDSDSEDAGPSGVNGRQGAQEISSSSTVQSSDEEEESDEDDDEDAPPQRISLAERLQRHRQENPIPVSDDDDEEDGSSDGGNSEEQDEDEEDDEEEDDEDEDGLLDPMAREGDSDDEEDEDDY